MHVQFNKQYQPWQAVDADAIGSLAHVFVDPEGWLVATDAYILAAVPCEISDAPEGFAGCLVGADFLKAAAKATKKLSVVPLDIDLNRLIATTSDIMHLLPPQSRFPTWRRAIPPVVGPADEHECTPYIAYNPWLYCRVALAIGVEKDSLAPMCLAARCVAGDPRIGILTDGAAIGLIMPGNKTVATDIRPHVHEITARLSTQRQRLPVAA